MKAKDYLMKYTYYIVIFLLTFLCLAILPFLTSDVGFEVLIPKTIGEWVSLIVMKGLPSLINVLLFSSFVSQGKLNVKDDVKYLKAIELLGKVKDNKYNPRSPGKWNAYMYGTKGTSIFFTTILSLIVLVDCILRYDLVAFLSYLFTIILGLVFGILNMKKSETYWSEEFYDYAVKKYNEILIKEGDNNGNII